MVIDICIGEQKDVGSGWGCKQEREREEMSDRNGMVRDLFLFFLSFSLLGFLFCDGWGVQ